MQRRLPLCVLAVLTLAGCAAEVDSADEALDQVEQPWFSGMGPTRGHEDILRFGVEFGNELIQDELQTPHFFPPVDEGDACFTTSNVLVTGNCITDWPDDEMISYYGVSSAEFGTDFDLQDLHYMRNFHSDTEAVSGRYACYRARERIIVATQRGMEFWSQGDEEGAFRWFGHATHNLQDSFATCHTNRTGPLYETLTDICTYKIELPGVCFHATGDMRDRIWQGNLECTVTSDREWDCLVPEAQSAAYATAGYLLVVARHIEAGMVGDLEAELVAFFEGDATNPHSGYYKCDALSDDGWEPVGWESTPGPDAGVEAGVDAAGDAALEDGSVEAGADAVVDAPDPEETGTSDSAAGGSGGSSGSGGSGGSAGPEMDAGTADSGADSSPTSTGDESESGCSCRLAPATRSHPAVPILVALMVAALLRRRQRSS